MTRAWKVGERCWVSYDDGERHVAKEGLVHRVRTISFDVSVKVSKVGRVSMYPAREHVFTDKADAEILAAERNVQMSQRNIEHDERAIADFMESIAEERKELAKAEKRLAALRAKVKP